MKRTIRRVDTCTAFEYCQELMDLQTELARLKAEYKTLRKYIEGKLEHYDGGYARLLEDILAEVRE